MIREVSPLRRTRDAGIGGAAEATASRCGGGESDDFAERLILQALNCFAGEGEFPGALFFLHFVSYLIAL